MWKYDDKNKIQKLLGLIALCPSCHKVKHIGVAQVQGKLRITLKHLAKVNKWTIEKAEEYAKEQFIKWEERNNFDWFLETSWLDENKGE